MKKQLLAVICAATMVATAAMPAMADNTQTLSGDGSVDIGVSSTVSKSDGVTEDTKVYNVDVSWVMTPGAYTSKGDIYTWDPEQLCYVVDTTQGSLEKTQDAGVTITVTNNSNASVNYTISYEPVKDGTNAISVETSTSAKSGTLDSAEPDDLGLDASPEEGTEGTAKSATYVATVGFDLDHATASTAADAMTMGTYTVTVTK